MVPARAYTTSASQYSAGNAHTCLALRNMLPAPALYSQVRAEQSATDGTHRIATIGGRFSWIAGSAPTTTATAWVHFLRLNCGNVLPAVNFSRHIWSYEKVRELGSQPIPFLAFFPTQLRPRKYLLPSTRDERTLLPRAVANSSWQQSGSGFAPRSWSLGVSPCPSRSG